MLGYVERLGELIARRVQRLEVIGTILLVAAISSERAIAGGIPSLERSPIASDSINSTAPEFVRAVAKTLHVSLENAYQIANDFLASPDVVTARPRVGPMPFDLRRFACLEIVPAHVPTAGRPDTQKTDDHSAVSFVRIGNNPLFRGQVMIHFGLSTSDQIEVKIFDVSGRLIRTLADRRFPTGEHNLVWGGGNNDGQSVTSGVYFLRIACQDAKFSARSKLTVLK